MYAFILAGGFATRLWPLTERRAKPLLPLAGEPLVEHLVKNIPDDIPVIISTNAVFVESFQEWKENFKRENLTVLSEDTVHDDHKLGALGAVSQWIEQYSVAEDVLLLTGDNYCGFTITDFLASAREGVSLLAAHDIGNVEEAKAFGTVIVEKDGRTITAFEEKPLKPKTSLVSTGCSFLRAEVLPVLVAFARQHPDNVGGIFEELLRQRMPVDCFQFSEAWFDIGSFESYLAATRSLVGRNTLLGRDATLRDTQCEGSIVIGDHSQVSGSVLCDTVLFEDCTIEDCILTDCILDRGCSLRGIDLTQKMLREGTRLLHPSSLP